MPSCGTVNNLKNSAKRGLIPRAGPPKGGPDKIFCVPRVSPLVRRRGRQSAAQRYSAATALPVNLSSAPVII